MSSAHSSSCSSRHRFSLSRHHSRPPVDAERTDRDTGIRDADRSGRGEHRRPASAPATVTNVYGNYISLNLQGSNQNTNSSKFHEYRDVPEGLAGPAFRVFGDSPASSTWLISGENLTQDDRRIYVWADTNLVEATIFYDVIPHRLGNDAKSIEKIVSNEAQDHLGHHPVEFPEPAGGALRTRPRALDRISRSCGRWSSRSSTRRKCSISRFTRQRVGVTVGLFPNAPFNTTVSVFQENRDGTRSSGSSFGFGNVVETAEPIEYRTRDVRLSAEHRC